MRDSGATYSGRAHARMCTGRYCLPCRGAATRKTHLESHQCLLNSNIQSLLLLTTPLQLLWFCMALCFNVVRFKFFRHDHLADQRMHSVYTRTCGLHTTTSTLKRSSPAHSVEGSPGPLHANRHILRRLPYADVVVALLQDFSDDRVCCHVAPTTFACKV